MNTPRPLRDVLGEQAERLAQDRQAVLGDAGHPDLPDALVVEAVVSYADTASHPVAEHLAPFVTAHSPVRRDEPAGDDGDLAHGLHLLATAPTDLDGADPAGDGFDFDSLDAGGSEGPPAESGWPDAADTPDFGGGASGDQQGRTDAPGEAEAVAGEELPVAGGEELPDLDGSLAAALPEAPGDHYLDLVDDQPSGPDGDDPADL